MNVIAITVLQSIVATRSWIKGRVGSDRGAAAVEYGLLVGLIAAVIVGAVALFGTDLTSIFNTTSSKICSGAGAACSPTTTAGG